MQRSPRPLFRFAHQAAKQGPHIQSQQGQPPQPANHFCRQTLSRARNPYQGNSLGRGQPIGPGFLSESSLSQPQPFFKHSQPAHVIRRLGDRIKFQRLALANNLLFFLGHQVNRPVIQHAFSHHGPGKDPLRL